MQNEWALLKTELAMSLAAEPIACLVCHSEPLFRGQNPCVSRFWCLSHPLVSMGSLKEKLIWTKFSSCVCRSVFSAEHFSPKRKHKSCFFILNHSNTADYSLRWIYTGISFAGSPIGFWIPCTLCSETIWGLSKQCVNQVPLGTLNVSLRALALNYISSLSLRASRPFFKYLTYSFSPVNLNKFRFHGLTPWFFHVSLSCFPQSVPPHPVPSHTSLPHGSASLSVPSLLPLHFHSESFSSTSSHDCPSARTLSNSDASLSLWISHLQSLQCSLPWWTRPMLLTHGTTSISAPDQGPSPCPKTDQ